MVIGSASVIGITFGNTENLNATLYDTLSQYQLNSDSTYADNFETYEQDNKCCGTTDLNSNNQPNCFQWGTDDIPYGCQCGGNDADNQYCITSQQAEKDFNCNTQGQSIYGRGCFDAIETGADNIKMALGISLVVVCGATSLAALVAVCLCCKSKK